MNLPVNTLLHGGKYRIVRFISSGGFGCTYEAEHVLLEKRVAIKEFFVKDFCNRDETTLQITVGTQSKKGLVEKLRGKFIEEAKSLCKLQHAGIVGVSDVFEENGTAYFVMDYVEGRSLGDIVNQEGPLSEERAVRYILAVAEALQYVHDNNRLHLDIKPGNVMIDSNDTPVLIDFGASKQYDEVDGENTSTLLGKTPGYAPPEQMANNVVKFTPATDVYALGATLYKLLTGITPPDAFLRMSGEEMVVPLTANISIDTRAAIAAAMEINRQKRTQSLAEFIKVLKRGQDESTVLGTGDSVDPNFVRPAALERQRISDIFEMVYVEGGTFSMGALPSDSDAWDDEKPSHSVKLSSYYMGRYEVTQKQWEAIMGSNPSFNKGDDLPVENVSWNDVQEFIRRLNEKTGKTYRLPTEAEWEYAARGGRHGGSSLYSGGDDIEAVAWYDGNSGERTHPVGTKLPNALGIYDMTGNVWEWCSDWYDEEYYSKSPSVNPQGPSSGDWRVLRGGSWYFAASECRVSIRNHSYPGCRNDDVSFVGFRLVLSAAAPAQLSAAELERQRISDMFEMVYVAGGTFSMGALPNDSDARDYEKPSHSVTLSSYCMGKYEVTQKQWEAIMGSNPSRFKGEDLPVEGVSWNDVQEFIRRLNEKTGKTYRLPTEAEWEYAARGGRHGDYSLYSGGNDIDAVAWYDGNSGERTHPVGTKLPNALGIYDMSGNVWEWCSDWYDAEYYSKSPSVNPQGPSSGAFRVFRGGSWPHGAWCCRVSCRHNLDPGSRHSDLGFRLVLSD